MQACEFERRGTAVNADSRKATMKTAQAILSRMVAAKRKAA
jgi:hypothetical protein